jgi:prepilin-type N-terminal cleavage/methylation domain-containing protein
MSSKAFSLVEVLVAISILAAMATIFSEQNLRSVITLTKRAGLAAAAAVFFSEQCKAIVLTPHGRRTKRLERSDLDLQGKIERVEINKKSPLAEFADDLEISVVSGSWSSTFGRYNLASVFVANSTTSRNYGVG